LTPIGAPTRLIGALSFAGSGVGFLVAFLALFAAEGPNAPSVATALAGPEGRHLFDILTEAGVVAVILYVVAAAVLYSRLASINGLAMLIVLAFAIVTASVFIGFLSLHHALTEVAKERSTSGADFQSFVVQAHAAADVGGWASIAMLAASVVAVSVVLQQAKSWVAIRYFGFVLAPIAVVLFVLDASYLFTVPFAIWELAVAGALVRSRT
jgi:hypothetical protein